MKTKMTMNRWQDSIRDLPWHPKKAAASAVNALAQFYWHDVAKEDAFNFILSLPAASFLRENPFILYTAWVRVLRQMTGESNALLELEPIVGTAA